MTKTYTTISDLAQAELRDALMGDDAFAALDSAAQDETMGRVTSLMRDRGLIVWVDGYDEATGRTYLNHEGFTLVLDDALEGADIWQAVSDVLDAEDAE